MANVGFTIEYPDRGDGVASAAAFPEGVRVIKWADMANGDVGLPYTAPQYPDKSVQVTGTPGTGCACSIQGSNVANGTPAYFILTDAQGNSLTFDSTAVTANKIEQVVENTWQIRPVVTAGDVNTSVTVRLLIFSDARR
jgi:hypothetical protein